MYEFDAKQQLPGLIDWMRQRMAECGGKTAVVGISGGKDSSVVAALCVAALAAEGQSRIMRIGHIDRGNESIERDLRALGADIARIETEQM